MTAKARISLLEKALEDYFTKDGSKNDGLHNAVGKLLSTLSEDDVALLAMAAAEHKAYNRSLGQANSSGKIWGGVDVYNGMLRKAAEGFIEQSPRLVDDVVRAYPDGQLKKTALEPDRSGSLGTSLIDRLNTGPKHPKDTLFDVSKSTP